MSYLAAPPAVGEVKINPAHTKMLSQWKYSSPLIGCRFDPSGRYVFAGAQDNAVARWELASGKLTKLLGHRSWVRGLAFTERDRLLFSADWAGRVLAWPLDAEKPEPKWSMEAHQGWVRALAVSPDGKLLASCGNDHLIKLWSLPEGKPVASLIGHECHVYNVAFHPEGRFLVSGDLRGVLKVWDLTTSQAVRELDAKILTKYDPTFRAEHGGVRSMAFDAEGKHLACAGITNVSNAFAGVGNPIILLFDWASGKQKLQMKPKAAFQGTAWGVVFHPNGYLLGVGGGNGGAFWAWKLDNPVAFHTLTLPNNARDLDLHPDRTRVAIPFFDGMLRLYDLRDRS